MALRAVGHTNKKTYWPVPDDVHESPENVEDLFDITAANIPEKNPLHLCGVIMLAARSLIITFFLIVDHDSPRPQRSYLGRTAQWLGSSVNRPLRRILAAGSRPRPAASSGIDTAASQPMSQRQGSCFRWGHTELFPRPGCGPCTRTYLPS